jgi:hypothetical protein
MNDRKDSTPKAKDPEEEIIEALPEEERERLVEEGTLVAFIDADGSTKYRIPSGFSRLFGANRRR